MEQSSHIIIIGAGAAGLMAARELSARYKVTILEAREVLGGRIRTVRGAGFTGQVEAGAEFIHGKLPISLALLKESGIDYHEIEGEMFQVINGKWNEQQEMIEGWDDLLKHMGEVKEDETMSVFLETHYSDEKHTSLRARVRNYLQGFDLADANKVSIKALYEEWSHEDEENFRTDKGYDQLIAFLAHESYCCIKTNSVVKQIEWQKGQVVVHTADGSIYNGDKVLITVSLGVLQSQEAEASITFTPAIDDYITAAKNIGFGSVLKVVLEFKKAFWEDHKQGIGFILSDEEVPTWWTQLPDKLPVLTGWLGGPPAIALKNESNEVVLEIALRSLAKIFNMDLPALKDMLVSSIIINWANDPWALGAYSYATPATTDAREKLNNPLAGTLFFAGEALYTGNSPGTVEAALNNGRSAALKILRSSGYSI